MKQRPIKFRFWCDAKKAFIQQYKYNGFINELFDQSDCFLTPTQYTGQNDYTGKEIWEGDILEFEKRFVNTPEPKLLQAVVEYIDCGFVCKILNPEGTLSYIHLYAFFNTYKFTNILRVIGNKFENANLLKCEMNK